jgi:hypothetical protein
MIEITGQKMIRITITPAAYETLIASTPKEYRPKGKPKPNPEGGLDIYVDKDNAAKFEAMRRPDESHSEMILRLHWLPWSKGFGDSFLAWFMECSDDDSPLECKLGAESAVRNFRDFVADSLKNAPGLYKDLGLDPGLDLNAVIDQALATQKGRDFWKLRYHKAGRDFRPLRRSFK